jgi:hypothetical protein
VSAALVTQHAVRMRHIFSSYVACLNLPYVYTLTRKRNDFGQKVDKSKMCVLIFSTDLSEKLLILEEFNEILSRTFVGVGVKYPLFLSYFNET